MKNDLRKILKDESGQGMLEYLVILALVVVAGLMFKDKIKSFFESSTDSVTGSAGNLFK